MVKSSSARGLTWSLEYTASLSWFSFMNGSLSAGVYPLLTQYSPQIWPKVSHSPRLAAWHAFNFDSNEENVKFIWSLIMVVEWSFSNINLKWTAGELEGVEFKTFSVNFNISFSMSQRSLGFHFSPFSGCIQTLKAGYIRVWFACCEKMCHQFWDIVRKRGDRHRGDLITFLFLFVLSFPPSICLKQ